MPIFFDSVEILDAYMNPMPEPIVMHGETFFIRMTLRNTDPEPKTVDFVVGVGTDIDPVDPETWAWNWRDQNVTVPPNVSQVIIGGFIMPELVPVGTYDMVIAYGELAPIAWNIPFTLKGFKLLENYLNVAVWTPPIEAPVEPIEPEEPEIPEEIRAELTWILNRNEGWVWGYIGEWNAYVTGQPIDVLFKIDDTLVNTAYYEKAIEVMKNLYEVLSEEFGAICLYLEGVNMVYIGFINGTSEEARAYIWQALQGVLPMPTPEAPEIAEEATQAEAQQITGRVAINGRLLMLAMIALLGEEYG